MMDERNFEMNACVREECGDAFGEHEDIDDNDVFMDEDEDFDDSYMFDEDEYLDDCDGFVDHYSNVEHSVEIMSTDEVSLHMEEVIERLSVLLRLPPITVRSLLAHFEWDEVKMLERYYSEDQEKLFAEAKIVNPYRESVGPELAELLEEKECPICARSVPYSELKSTVCGHGFCVECWATYLKVCILDQGLSPQITCPASGCDTLLDDAFILSSGISSKAERIFKMAIIRDFIQRNRLLRWCPTPGCEKVMKVENVRTRRVICSCAFIYCFDCGQEWHEPVPCRILRSWIKLSECHMENVRWIKDNTKECPQCHMDIQKKGGCDTMRCANKGCFNVFCWLCLGPAHTSADWRFCNPKKVRNDHVTNRLKFFLLRFAEQSALVARTRDSQKRMANIADDDDDDDDDFLHQSELSSKRKVHFLSKAANILSDCCRTLMNSCIIAYHVETQQNNQSIIFKNHQDALESASKSLLTCLNYEIESHNIMEMEARVTELFRHCYKRWKILVEHTQEGIDKNWWSWSEDEF